MPPSQLKRLKSSLREQGITGQQKSKKHNKQAKKNGSLRDTRIQRNAALESIRDQFNPFDLRTPARASKHEFVTNKPTNGKGAKGSVARPGITKGLGEENRRQTLLKEIQRRKKVGGIQDRRFGENDPMMTPEEKALERFVKEKQRGSKKNTLFDLEDGDEDEELTHFGQSLSFDKTSNLDNFHEEDLSSGHESDHFNASERPSKRQRLSADDDLGEESMLDRDDEQPARPKTKKEVMSEVMAKSKLHKYERQQAKEDDDDLRAELDKGLPDLLAFMRGAPRQLEPQQPKLLPNGNMNPDRAAILDGKDRAQAEKEYDERLRQMTFDKRSKPTEPTLTEEEKLEVEAQRLQDLEQQRLFRMKGEQVSDDEEQDQGQAPLDGRVDSIQEEQDSFGLGPGLGGQTKTQTLGVEDEDDFIIEDELVLSDTEPELSEDSSSADPGDQIAEDEDEEFVQGLYTGQDTGTKGISNQTEDRDFEAPLAAKANDLAYTFNCPQSHEEFLQITRDTAVNDQPTIVQRIRALYHPQLQAGNKAKLAVFSGVLVDHIYYLADHMDGTSFATIEALVRHVHSLAKMFPEDVGRAFRAHLKSLIEERALEPTVGDLILFTAIGTTFPTSDHFHQVVTPTMLYIGFYLSQRVPQRLDEIAKGVYLGTLCLQYQELSKRYIPELLGYIANAMSALAPAQPRANDMGCFPLHSFPESFRLTRPSNEGPRKLNISDTVPAESNETEEALKLALLNTLVCLCGKMANVWNGLSVFAEIFEPVATVLRHLGSKACTPKLGKPLRANVHDTLAQIQQLLQQARITRKPLLLHNHRPLAIKTSIPKFDESFNPDKHYDPDRDRAETNKLKAEHKKERKGALRELRKDANFIARESLREKKETDAQYEKKYKRLVAEIQGEEGRESKIYEREKRMRKGKK
ncbi:MAG: hypothetical protein Q9168_003350 [Polycauliona sp. 1 TL-2023]